MATADCRTLVIGAGISGLACAFRLAARGIHVEVIEAAARAGGVIESVSRDGILIERGPNSLLDTGPHISAMLDQLGIQGERIDTPLQAAKRYVVHGGKLVALPASPPALLRTPLFSPQAKLRLLREPFARRAANETEETVAEFVLRRLGREFLDYAVEPFVAGIYAGDPAELSLPAAFPRLHALEQRYGSLIVGQIRGARERAKQQEKAKNRARSFSFASGLQTLTDALASRIGRVHFNTRAAKLRPGKEGITVTVNRDGACGELQARVVVLAVPAWEAASLVSDFAPAAATALEAIPYAPVASVASVYRRADIAHALDGFGFLAPRVEQRRILGTLFSSTMFGGRARQGEVLLTTFLGGRREPTLPNLPDTELTSIVNAELAALLGASSPPRSCAVSRWPRAIPQYTIGHLERIRAAAEAENALPGLFLCASYRNGVAVGDCIASACRTAQSIAQRVDYAR